MKTMSFSQLSSAFRAGIFSSFAFLSIAGQASAQEPLILDDLKLIRSAGEACTITFEADPDLQIIVWSSSDLSCWNIAGPCLEFDHGSYQYIDIGAIELPGQFYRFEVFDPEVALPPQFEQLRAEMGDEQFAQWLESNFDHSGTLQGMLPQQIARLGLEEQEQIDEVEKSLQLWLEDFYDEAEPLPIELELPQQFDDFREFWGDYDLARLLDHNLDSFGNMQGICEPLIIEWEQNEPIRIIEFEGQEQALNQWLDDFLAEQPPLVLEDFGPEDEPLPPQLEQMKLELGDQAFAEWLQMNAEQSGNYQGVHEAGLPKAGSVEREQFEAVEIALENWFSKFEKSLEG